MHIALGITGCIGAYKGALLVRELQRHNVDATVIMTKAARNFIGPATFEALTGRRVITDLFAEVENREITHISLARRVDALLVAPATANIVGKFANGIADDFLSTFFLAIERPVVIAPAMNKEMWSNKAVQSNIEILKKRGMHFVDPVSGWLACGEVGEGRLADPVVIVEKMIGILSPAKQLLGKKLLITAGPTREPLDKVRFLSNRSTGKMGYAVAGEARRRGASVVLISGPTEIEPPVDIKLIRIQTASDMASAVKGNIADADALIMTAAVADFRPKKKNEGKIKKTRMPEHVELERTDDILESLNQSDRVVKIGFAAESENLVENAKRKMESKKLDLIVANDITEKDSGFGSDTNRVITIDRDGIVEEHETMPKRSVAAMILDKLSTFINTK